MSLDHCASFLTSLAEINRHVPHCGGQALDHALQEVVAAIQATPWRQWPVARWQRRIDRAAQADGMPASFGGNGREKHEHDPRAGLVLPGRPVLHGE